MPKIPNEKIKGKEKSFGKPETESLWWGAGWFELTILILFIFALSGLLIPFLTDQFRLNWEYFLIIIDHIVRPMFIIADAILALAFVFAFIKSSEYIPPFSIFQKYNPTMHGDHLKVQIKDQTIFEQWNQIKTKAATGTAESMRLAFIEADSLVDVFLRKKGLLGETMGERLNQVSMLDAPNLQAVWNAHRLRNEVVHSPGFSLSIDEAKIGLEAFEEFLTDLGGL